MERQDSVNGEFHDMTCTFDSFYKSSFRINKTNKRHTLNANLGIKNNKNDSQCHLLVTWLDCEVFVLVF